MYQRNLFHLQDTVRWTFTATYALLLTYVLLSASPWEALGGDLLFRTTPDPSDTASSITLHILAYALLGFLVAWSVFPHKKQSPWIVITVFHGLFTEMAQGFIPHRFTNEEDIVSNLLGVLLGWYLGKKILPGLKNPIFLLRSKNDAIGEEIH